MPITASVTPVHPAAHLFAVELTLTDPDPAEQVFSLPVWIPGSYLVREFARNIVEISAQDSAGPAAVHKVSKSAWAVRRAKGAVTLKYTVYAWDLSVRCAHLDQTHGYFNGTSLFLCPQGFESEPYTVNIRPPTDPACAGWRVATTLPQIEGEEGEFGVFRAKDYDELIDHPVEMGLFEERTVLAAGVPHRIAVTGRHRGDIDRLAADTARICEAHAAMFGGLPMRSYLFQLMLVEGGYGGLEHRDSTSLIFNRSGMPRPGAEKQSDEYTDLLGLISHEYFHLWNVKRIKPAAFTPYDLTQENYTTLLWAFEGITSYYDDLGLLRAGVIDAAAYLERLGQTATRVYPWPGRLKQPLADSSFDAWVKLYRPDENSLNATISYYTKGALAALALDLTLRLRTEGRVSLDDVMRALWERYGKTGQGVPEDGVERLAAELCGQDMGEFFDLAIRGTEDLPLPQLLEPFGIAFRLRPAESPDDKGGKPAGKPVEELKQRGDLRVRVASAGGGAKLTHVLDGGAAQEAGLSAGDVVVAVDGMKVDGSNLISRISSYKPGAALKIHAFRADELREFTATLQAPPDAIAYFELLSDAPDDAVARRKAWLGG